MIYQVRANLYFDSEDEARDFVFDCENAFIKTCLVNPHTEAEEPSTIELIQNHHDEDPNAPCSVTSSHSNSTST